MDAWTFEEFQKDFYENNKQKPKDKSLYTLYLKSLNTIKKDSKVPEEVKDYVDDLIAWEREQKPPQEQQKPPDNSTWWRKMLAKLTL
ncbi:unnamed protein product [Mucor hiemalis]